MTRDVPTNTAISDADDPSSSSLATIVSSVSDLVSGVTIPAPIRRNAIKAFGQLCAAAIDIPVAYLEGAASEKRAETQARIRIITTGADQIAAQMNVDPEFARVAANKYGQKILREQVNLNKVSEVAAIQMRIDSAQDKNVDAAVREVPEINDDWLNSFEIEASQKSTDEMQRLFGKILASEIRQPSSFSIKTVKLISQLDNRTASLFRLLCSLSISLRSANQIIDARVVVFSGSAASNALQTYGLGFDQLNILQEYGLIISDYNSYMNYGMCIANQGVVSIPFRYQDADWGLLSTVERPIGQEMRMNGVALSRSGKELISIVDIEPNDVFTTGMTEFFQKQNMQMLPITKQVKT